MVKDLRYLYQVTETQSVHWHQVEVVLLPKPSKPLSTPASLRPISLLLLYAEVLAQLVARRIEPILTAAAQTLGQFAYLPSRQAADALDRALVHCAEVRAARKASSVNVWKRHQGCVGDTCAGGKAFVTVD